MKVALGADHGGFELKNELARRLRDNHDIIDLGAKACDKDDDYPDFALAVANAIVSGDAQRGIIICGSGVGACIAANKVPGIRACLCHDTYSAHQGVEHDDMNVLCLGARVIAIELAMELATTFLESRYAALPRYERRRQKVNAIEQRIINAPRELSN